MVFIHQMYCSFCLNSMFNKFRVRKNVFGQVSCKFFSWNCSNSFQNGKKKYYSFRKPGKVLPTILGWKYSSGNLAEWQTRSHYSSNVKGLSENKISKTYSITVSSLKAVLDSNEFIIKKTVGKPKGIVPLSFIQIENCKAGDDKCNSEFKMSNKNPPSSKITELSKESKNNEGLKEPSSIHHLNPIGPFFGNYDGDQNTFDTTETMVSSQSKFTSSQNSSKMDLRAYIKNCTSDYEEEKRFHGRKNLSCYSRLDTIIINPNEPLSRIIIHFKNKTVYVVEPSDFDYLSEAHYCLKQTRKSNSGKTSRINFIKFEKVGAKGNVTSENKKRSHQLELGYVILKRQDSICLENISNKLWIPISTDPPQKLIEVPLENNEGHIEAPIDIKNNLSSGGDSDSFITKIPIRKETLIDEKVVPSKSILDILNSVDRSAVIIHKDLYITNRIIQKIKEEKKKEEKNQEKTIGVKGMPLSGRENNNLNFSTLDITPISLNDLENQRLNYESLIQDYINNLQDLHSKYNMFLESMHKLINQTGNIIFLQTNENKKNQDNFLLFSPNKYPDFKGLKTTDIIKKAASIINKDGYYQKKISNAEKGDQYKNLSQKEVNLKTPSTENNPPSKTTDKCSEADETLPFLLGNSEIVKINSYSDMNLNKISPEKNAPPVINIELGSNNTTPLKKSMNSENLLENNKPMPISEIKDNDNYIKMKSEPDFNQSESGNNPCPKHLIKNDKAILNDSIDNNSKNESLSSFVCTPWDDKSVDCLMSSKDCKNEKEIKEKTKKKTTGLSLTKNINNKKTTETEYKTKTLITVTKKKDFTDINIAEKETFIDSSLPIPFSTETFFQIFGSTSTIQKEALAFENIKKGLISSLENNNSNNSSQSSREVDVAPPDPMKKDNVKTEEDLSTKSLTNKIVSETEKFEGTIKNTLKKSVKGIISHKKDKVNSKRGKRSDKSVADKNESSRSKNLDDIRKSTRKMAIKKLQSDIEKLKNEYALNSKTEPIKPIDEEKEKKPAEGNKQNYSETYVNLLENVKKNSYLKQKQRKLRGIIDHKSLSNRDKKILKEILKEKLKNKKSVKTVKKPSTRVSDDKVWKQNKTDSTKTLNDSTIKDPIYKTVGISENMERNNQAKTKNTYDQKIITREGNYEQKIGSKVGSTASEVKQPQVKSFDTGYSYSIDINKGSSQPNAQFQKAELKQKFENNSKFNVTNNQHDNSNKKKEQKNITKNINYNRGSKQEKGNTPETESTTSKNLRGGSKIGEINNSQDDNPKLGKKKSDLNRNHDGLIIQKKNSEAIVNYAKKLAGTIKGQINDKYLRTNMKELAKPLSSEKAVQEKSSPDVKNNNTREFPILPGFPKKNNEESKENSSNQIYSNSTTKGVGSNTNKGNTQITVIENHKLQNTNEDYKEIFQKNLLEKVQQKIELKNPINFQKCKIKQSSAMGSFKAAQIRKQNKPNSIKMSLLNPLNKMKGNNIKLSVKALPERKQNKKLTKGKTASHLVVENKLNENSAKKTETISGPSTTDTQNKKVFPKDEHKQDQYIQTSKDKLDKTMFKQQDNRGKIKQDIQKPIKPQEVMKAKDSQMAQKANCTQDDQKVSSVKEDLKSSATKEVKIVKDKHEVEAKQVYQTINSEQTKTTGILSEIKEKETSKDKKIEINTNKEQDISLGYRSINIDQSTQIHQKQAEANEKSNKSPQTFSQIKSSNEPPFPTLLIDIDKMAKEIRPDFDKKNRRTCLVPHERIKDFPLWNSRKAIDLPSPQTVIKVCPSKDPQLKNDLKLFPSVTKILNVTLPKESKDMMKLWWKNMNTELGEKGFRFYYKDEITRGNQFHNLVQDHLLWGKGGGSTPSSLFFKSLGKILDDVKDLSVINSHVVHSTLAYRGVIDCVAKYKSKPVVVEWKRLDHREAPNLPALESAFQQLSAYIGAINYDQNYNFQVRAGVLVLAYSDGSDADLFYLQDGDCEKYWQLWLNRLHTFHSHMKNNRN